MGKSSDAGLSTTAKKTAALFNGRTGAF